MTQQQVRKQTTAGGPPAERAARHNVQVGREYRTGAPPAECHHPGGHDGDGERTVLAWLTQHMPSAEAEAVTDDLEAQVNDSGYGTARTSAGFVSVSRYVNGQLSIRLNTEA